MNREQKQAVEMLEIDTADFHITHRLDDGEEPILHLRTAKSCPNKRNHLNLRHFPMAFRRGVTVLSPAEYITHLEKA